MKVYGFRVYVVVLSLLVILAVLFGAHTLYNRLNYEEPLTRALKANKVVGSFVIEEEVPKLRIVVGFNPTFNIRESYSSVRADIEEVVQGRPFELIIKDNRDALLNNAFYRCHYAVYEALVTGNYLQMAKMVEKTARESGIEAGVFVDLNYVYLELKHENRHLYEVFPRK